MEFQLSEEHRLIQETARRIAKERIAPRAAEVDETGEYPHDIFQAFREVGLLGLTIPQAYGGSGAGTLPLALAVEEAAKYCCSAGLMLLLPALATHPILLGGSDRQKQAWLPRAARGEIKGAFCLTEPNAGSDAAAIESRAVVGARGLGLAEGAMTYALEYARQRQAFGRPIAELQAIQFMFADMVIQIEAARLLVYQGAWLLDQRKYQREHAALLSVAKTFATEVGVKVSSDALQVLGAQGYMMDHPLERHYRDARQLMIVEGTSQVQRVVIARALLERELVYP